MKCRPFGRVNSVTFFSNSLRFCAGSHVAPKHNRTLKPVTLTAFPRSFTSIENSRTYLFSHHQDSPSAVRLAPRVLLRYPHDCLWLGPSCIMDLLQRKRDSQCNRPTGGTNNSKQWKELPAIAAIPSIALSCSSHPLVDCIGCLVFSEASPLCKRGPNKDSHAGTSGVLAVLSERLKDYPGGG